MPRPYPWPASRLRDADTMHDLHILSKAHRIPITRLIADGVRQHVAALRDQMDEPRPQVRKQRRRPELIGFSIGNAFTKFWGTNTRCLRLMRCRS